MTKLTLNVKNNQQAFNKVVRHLAAQERRSHDDYGCVYRSDDGLKCAVGALIDDDQFDLLQEQWDAWSSPNSMGWSSLSRKFDTTVDELLLGDLQAAHDEYSHWDHGGFNKAGVEDLRNVARKHGLRQYQIKRSFGASRSLPEAVTV